MHGTYASKPKPKPVNTSRLGNGNPNHTQPITANYTKLGFKPKRSRFSSCKDAVSPALGWQKLLQTQQQA